jgi:hypothetical protein
MAITLSTAAKNAACNAVVDLLDAGGAGTVVILTAADVVLGTFTLAATAFGAAVNGIATAAAIADVLASAAGDATKFSAKNNAGTTVFSGTAGEAAADMILSEATVAAGDVLHVVSWTHTQP